MAFLLSLEGIQRRDLDTEAKLFAALGQPVLMHGADLPGTRANKRAVG